MFSQIYPFLGKCIVNSVMKLLQKGLYFLLYSKYKIKQSGSPVIISAKWTIVSQGHIPVRLLQVSSPSTHKRVDL